MDTKGKVAFITGGGSGIGLGMAKAFLAADLKVAIADVRADRLDRAKETFAGSESNFLAIEADVTDLGSLNHAADQVESHFGKVHIVCNNAGIGVGGLVHSASMDQWHRVVNVNLWGVIHGCHVFTPRIQSHGEGGHIVNTASIMGLYTARGSGPYCATKFAVVAISECMRAELQESSIGVSVLCPFIVDTPIFYPDLDDLDTEGIERRKKQMGLMRHALPPVFVGEKVLSAIQSNELYIFTDGTSSRQMIQSRIDGLNESMDRLWPVEESASSS